MKNIQPGLLILIGLLVVVAALGLWRLFSPETSGNENAVTFQRIKQLANNDDQAALADAVANKDVKSSYRAVRAMGRVGPKAISGIRLAMKDPRPKIRVAAMIAVSRAGDESDRPVLAKIVLADPSPEVKMEAAKTLGRTGAYTEIESLFQAMEDGNEKVRFSANESIVKISGVSVGFDAKAPSAQRKIAIGELRALYSTVRSRTEQFWQNKKRYKEEHPED
jgi:HEAT repeat protein